MGRGVRAALQRLLGGGQPATAEQSPPVVAGDDDVAQALREWLGCLFRLDTTLRLGFAKKISIDFDQLTALNADESRAWNHLRATRLMREEPEDEGK